MPSGPWLAVPTLLVVEAIVIIALAEASRPRPVRFAVAWFLTTFVTCVAANNAIANAAAGEAWNYRWPSVLKTELLVIVIEAGILWVLLRWRFLVRNPGAQSLWTVLCYSVIANGVSFIGGVATLLLGG